MRYNSKFFLKQSFNIFIFWMVFILSILSWIVVYATISWPSTPDGETAGWSIGTLITTFTIDSWNVWIWKTPTTKLDVNWTITATNIAWIISNATQSNITSIWTLTSLTVTGDTVIDTSTLFVDTTNNRVWIWTITP